MTVLMGRIEEQLKRTIQALVTQYHSTQTTKTFYYHTDAILKFAKARDHSLNRKKDQNLRKIIELVLKEIKENDAISEENDSEYDAEPNVEYMVVNDKNSLNNSLYNMYKPAATESSTPEDVIEKNVVSLEEEPKADAVTLNKKKRTRESIGAQNSKKSKSSAPAADTSEKACKTQTPTAKLSDMGGIEHCIEDILQLIQLPLQHPEIYTHLGIKPPRGILFHGPPGCGKTMLANAVANECGVPFVTVSAPSIVSGMSGESEKKIREVFDEAKTLSPCILFIDEIDAITPKRETAQREMERRIVAQLLTCMDDVGSSDKTVLIIGATNRVDSIDSALRRGGRFDREICMGVPDESARMRILEKMSSGMRLGEDLDFSILSKQSPGYVGADLAALTSEAGMIALKRIYDSVLKIDSSQGESMDIDECNNEKEPTEGLNTVKNLSKEQLDSIYITQKDFLDALQVVQPSSKREGFATVPDVSWDRDVGAMTEIREELQMTIVEPIRNPDLFKSVGVSSSCGVLLWGPPGTGKTLCAKAIANESHCNFLSVKGPELLNKFVGESESNIRQVFARAKASSPCIIFFDELDAICPNRSNDSESQSSSRLVNTLLTEMDGMESRKQVYVIAATNRPDMIDPAMLRPGRLDKCLYVDLPNEDDRHKILSKLVAKIPNAQMSVNELKELALHVKCDGLSGADLAALVREAGYAAVRGHFKQLLQDGGGSAQNSGEAVKVEKEHFWNALNSMNPSVSKKDRAKYELLKVRFNGSK